MKIINYFFIGSITCLRPLLGPSPSGCCKFEIGCTEYAIQEFQNKSLFKAIYNIIKRLCLCNPLYN